MEEARRPALDASVRAFVSTPAREFVPRWYVMLYQIIRGTQPALARAIDRSPRQSTLREFFEQKKREEFGHDEVLLGDLRRVGVSEYEAKAAPVNPWIAEMVGRQFYLIECVHPAIYLGYIALLEGFQPTSEQIDAVQVASGFPPEAFSCARLHAKADIGHREEVAKMLDDSPAGLRPAILANGARCAALRGAAQEYLSQQESPHE
jgi:hypothetical protein